MAQESKHNDGHGHARKRGFHRDWRVWTVVALMLAAMFAYVVSDDESLQFSNRPQQTAPHAVKH